jgi:hypothetical protein
MTLLRDFSGCRALVRLCSVFKRSQDILELSSSTSPASRPADVPGQQEVFLPPEKEK